MSYNFVQMPKIRVKVGHSSFPIIHKVVKIGIFVLLKLKITWNSEINHFKMNSNCYVKCQFVLKLIQTSQLFLGFSNIICTTLLDKVVSHNQ